MIRTITPIFSIIIALVVFFFFVKPMFAEIQQIQGETDQYQQAVGKATELNQLLTALVSKKRSYSAEEIERLEALVPQSVDEVKILADLNELAKSHSMLFGNIKVTSRDEVVSTGEQTAPSQTVSYDDFVTSDITFGLIGTYEQFKAMLSDLEKSLVLMEITNITLSASDGPLQQFELTVRAYSLPVIK